jgi:hypothetical protein
MVKKRQVAFHFRFELVEIFAVSHVNGTYFCRFKMKDGSFSAESPRCALGGHACQRVFR